jgi:hypothetical protein
VIDIDATTGKEAEFGLTDAEVGTGAKTLTDAASL